MKRTCAYILCHGAKSHPLYQPWLDKIQHQVVEEYDESWEPPDDCGIVISHLHYDFPNTAILSRITKQNLIPVLILSDGILEFRNTFQNPKVAAGSIFMPLHGHKLACIGSSQLRIVNGFGNVGKCELVGLPRFDSQIEKPRPSIDTPSNPNLLIATARQPGFNPLQIGQVRRSLSDLKSEIEKLNRPKRRLNVLWRLTGDLESQLGISPKESVSQHPLDEVLQRSSAVISTPSTLILEGQLAGLPTAMLDYSNSPKYVHTAWNLTAREQMNSTIESLLAPEPSRMLYQEQQLADALEISSPATPRMIALVQQMIEIGNHCAANEMELEFPKQILNEEFSNSPSDENRSSIRIGELFPGRLTLQVSETEANGVLFDQAVRQIEQLRKTLIATRDQIAFLRIENAVAQRKLQLASQYNEFQKSYIRRLQRSLKFVSQPTSRERQLNTSASIAFHRWLFYVEATGSSPSRQKCRTLYGKFFDWVPVNANLKIPPTVPQKAIDLGKPAQVMSWKFRPTDLLIKKVRKSIGSISKSRCLRVMRAPGFSVKDLRRIQRLGRNS